MKMCTTSISLTRILLLQIAVIPLLFFANFFTDTAYALNPGGVATPTVWFDASVDVYTNAGCTTPATNGQTVGCWKDQSGNARNANAAVNTPTLSTSFINGQSVIVLNKPDTNSNTGDIINLTGVNLSNIITSSAYTIFVSGLINADYSYVGGQEPKLFGDATADPSGSKFYIMASNASRSQFSFGHDNAGSGVSSNLLDTFGNGGHLLTNFGTAAAEFTAGNLTAYVNGHQPFGSAALANLSSVTGGVKFGSESNGTRYDTNFGDVIVYNRALSATERQQIDSYLSIKYGRTYKDYIQGINQGNYLDTTGAIIWNGLAAGGTEANYHADVIALGKDTGEGLDKTSTRSLSQTGLITLSNPTDMQSGEYFFIGRDQVTNLTLPLTATFTTTGAPTNAQILNRKWKARETGEVGTTTFAINMANTDFDIPPAPAGTYYFIADSNNNGSLTDEVSYQMYDDGTNGDVTAGDNVWTIQRNIGTGIFTLASKTVGFEGDVYTNEGITKVGAGVAVRLLVNGASAVTATTDATGHYIANIGIPNAGDIITVHVNSGVASEDGVTVTRWNGTTFTGYDIYAGDLITRTENGTPLSNNDLDTANDGDTDITNIYSNGLTTTLTLADSKNLYIWSGHTFTPAGNVNLGASAAGTGVLRVKGILNAGASTITINGSLDVNNAGTLTHTGTLQFNGNVVGSTYNQGDDPISSNIIIANTTTNTGISIANNPMNTSGNLSINIAGGSALSLAGNNITVGGTFTNLGTLRLYGSETTSLTQYTAAGIWLYTGDGDGLADTYTIKEFGVTDYFLLIIVSTDGIIDTFNIVGSPINTAASFSLQGGIFNTNGNNLTIGTSFQQSGVLASTFNASASVITVGTVFSLTASGGAGQPAIFNAGSGALNIGTNYSQSGSSPSTSAFVGSTGAVDVNGTFSASASGVTFTAPSTSLNVASNFTHSLGTFNHNNGTVILDKATAGNQTVTGNTTFYNLTKQDTVADGTALTLNFANGSVTTVANTLTLQGNATDDLIIRTNTNGTLSTINSTGALYVTNDVNVRDSTLQQSGVTKSPALNPSSSVNTSNTFGWFDANIVVEFTNATDNANEATTSPVYTVSVRGGTTVATSTINVAVTGGTATGGGTDYTFATPITITIPPGNYSVATTFAIPLTIIDDAIVESTETITFTLQTPTGSVSIGDANVNASTQTTNTFSIIDNDIVSVTAEFSAATAASTNEATANNFPKLFISGTLVTSQTIDVAVTGGTATGGGTDYTFATQTVTIPAGTYDGTIGTAITVTAPTLVQDSIVEAGGETIIFTLQNPSSGIAIGDANSNATTQTTHTYTITDDDVGSVIVELSSATAASTNETTANNFPKLLVSGIITATTSIVFDTIGGTATGGGTDYTLTDPLTVIIPAGTYDGLIGTAITITAPTLVQDSIVESGGETITFSLITPGANVNIGDANANTVTQTTHTYTITDDDTLLVEFTTQTPSALESVASPTWTLTVGGVITTSATTVEIVNLGTGTATNGGVDFSFTSPVTITIPAGDYTTPSTINITGLTIVEDIISEVGGETINFSLQNPSGVTLGDADGNTVNESTATFTITDNDSPAVVVAESAGTTNIAEGGATDTYTIALATLPTANVTITITPNAQCTVSPAGPLIFSGITAQTITVTAVDDAVTEGAHTCTITHTATSADTNYNAISIVNVIANVTDNDTPSLIVVNTGGASIREPDPNTVGTTDTISVALATAPTGNVTVTLTRSNGYIVLSGGGGTLQPTITLTFTPANYATPQVVTLTAVDDTLVNGTRSASISFAASSTDLNYNSLITPNLSVSVLDGADEDGDGVSNAVEAANPFNGGDGNGDGTPDSEQQNVSGAPNPVTGAYTTLQASGSCVFITQNAFVAESSLTSQDSVYNYPVGLVDFQVQCPGAGMSSNIKLYYTQSYDTSSWSYKKYNSVGRVYSDITTAVTFGTQTIGGTPVTTASFTATDGDPATDEDGVANNLINDPSGPATIAPVITPPASTGGGGGGSIVLPVTYYNNSINKSLSDLIGGGEPNVPTEFSDYVCKRYLRSYMYLGNENKIVEVKKLQEFLNISQGEKLVIDGTYDQEDYDAVIRFQQKYSDQILAPWGLKKASGIVGITTVAKINIMMCSTQKGCPYFNSYLEKGDTSLDTVRLQDFINIIFAPTSGYPTKGISLSKDFNKETFEGVKRYQDVYKDIVLKPWGLKSASGWFYQTSRHAANKLLNCNEGEIKLDNGKLFK